MKRTHLSLAAAIAVGASSAASAETLILSTNLPPTHLGIVHGLTPFMECVKQRTAGGIDFNFFPSEQIATQKAALDALNSNMAQVSYIVSTALSDKLPLANISILPNMGVNTTEMTAAFRKVVTDGGPMADELKANHIVPIYYHMFPPYQLGLREGKIASLADIAGKKLRVAGGSQVFAAEAMGAVPTQIASTDAYVALQQATVDGYGFALTSIDAYKLQEVTGSITTNTNLAGGQAIVGMDDRIFPTLSADNQKALLDCGAETEASLVAYQDTLVAELEKSFAAVGVEMYALDEATLAELNSKLDLAVEDYVKRLEALGLPAQAALDQYQAALKQ